MGWPIIKQQTAQKWSFRIKISLVNMNKWVQFYVALFTFTKGILNGKFYFLRSDGIW